MLHHLTTVILISRDGVLEEADPTDAVMVYVYKGTLSLEDGVSKVAQELTVDGEEWSEDDLHQSYDIAVQHHTLILP